METFVVVIVTLVALMFIVKDAHRGTTYAQIFRLSQHVASLLRYNSSVPPSTSLFASSWAV
jgi:hypothetical protein